MRDWKARLFSGLAFYLIASLHQHIYQDVFKNTPDKMLLYHASAALADLVIIHLARYTLTGAVRGDIQRLNLCAIIVNFIGWVAYLAYASPATYNLTIMVLGYVQYIRLLWADQDASNTVGLPLVRRDHLFRS